MNKGIVLTYIGLFLFGYGLRGIINYDENQNVEITRSLIKLADDACKNNGGAKSYTKDMAFVCNDGTKVITP